MAKTVLVADPERAILRLVEVNLQHNGYRVLKVPDVRAAVEYLETEHVDLILLRDWMVELKDHIAADPATRDIPVLVMPPKAPMRW